VREVGDRLVRVVHAFEQERLRYLSCFLTRHEIHRNRRINSRRRYKNNTLENFQMKVTLCKQAIYINSKTVKVTSSRKKIPVKMGQLGHLVL
jgi:hypothetical protein